MVEELVKVPILNMADNNLINFWLAKS